MKITNTNALPYVSVLEAAEQLRVSKQRVHQLIKQDKLSAKKSGNIILVAQRSIEARLALLEAECEAHYGVG